MKSLCKLESTENPRSFETCPTPPQDGVVTMNIYVSFHVNTARDVVTVLLVFVNIYHFIYTFSHAHTEAHTHKHTRMISTQEAWRQTCTGAWLGGTRQRLLIETKVFHKKKMLAN